MPLNSIEKSPLDKWDYEGLRVDTRAKDNTEKHLEGGAQILRNNEDSDNEDNYLYEKQAAGANRAQTLPQSPGSTTGLNRETSSVDTIDVVAGLPPEPKIRKIGGVRRHHFWIAFGIIFALIIATAVIGGVIGATRHSSSSASSNITSNDTTDRNLTPQFNVVIGSPLSVMSYEENTGVGTPQSRQVFRLYFQTASGNVKEAVSTGSLPWQTARPIFTDATNNTGLATITYSNNSMQQGSIFYVGSRGYLREKRKILNSSDYWEPGRLSSMYSTSPFAKASTPSSDDGPQNGWDRFRMAAVFSKEFYSGPGARLFYHADSSVQELIWDQKSDSWTPGTTFPKAFPTSHLAATIDESTKLLRLFYSNGNGGLQEQVLNITDPKAIYVESLNQTQFLTHSSTDMAAVSYNGTTYLYHYHNGVKPTIYEDHLSGFHSSTSQEKWNQTNSLVASPQLNTTGGFSPYQPLAAAITNVKGMDPKIFVFWADNSTGPWNASESGSDMDVSSGYANLWETSRMVSSKTWPNDPGLQATIPLVDNDTPTVTGR